MGFLYLCIPVCFCTSNKSRLTLDLGRVYGQFTYNLFVWYHVGMFPEELLFFFVDDYLCCCTYVEFS